MERFQSLLMMAFLVGGITCFLRGYGTSIAAEGKDVKTGASAISQNKAAQIETRVQEQLDTIRPGKMGMELAGLLSDNARMIRRFKDEYSAASKETGDLTAEQLAQLNGMLDDNARFIKEAEKSKGKWTKAIKEEGFSFLSAESHGLYICKLLYQLKVQERVIKLGTKPRKLSGSQVETSNHRIAVMRELMEKHFQANGRLDLSGGQVVQVSRMFYDNANFIQYVLANNPAAGRYDFEHFEALRNRQPAKLRGSKSEDWSKTAPKEGL